MQEGKYDYMEGIEVLKEMKLVFQVWILQR